ncbi:hypothetical protein F5X99DRAFT_139524 [Biscogniauxia marginata]|nr:hypothetical protein F5X99DRAFT_139524 [Biscogniauxia marginata]
MDSSTPAATLLTPDRDRGASLIAIYSSQCGLSLIFLVLRFWSRIYHGGVSWDDVFMALSWVFYAALTVLVALMATNGGFRHAYYLDGPHAGYVLKLNYISRPFGVLPLLTVKIAACYLIFRILKGTASKRIRYSLWTLLTINTVLGILDSIFTFAQCDIPAALWEPSLAPKSTCWDPSVKNIISIITASLNVVVDLVLAVTPAVKIWYLHMSIQKRLGLIALFGNGLFSVISASVKTYKLAQSTKPLADPTWESYELFAWTSAEIFVLHFCASIPTYKPLWMKYIAQKRRNAYSSQGYKLPRSDYTTGSANYAVTSVNSDTMSYGLQHLDAPSVQDSLPLNKKGNSIQVTRSVILDRECKP